MLQIQVLGKGLIPRGLGLAPRTQPFPADLNLISTIMQTPGLKVNYMNASGEMVQLTQKTVKKVWEEHLALEQAKAAKAKAVAPKPAPAPATPPAPPVVETPKEKTPPPPAAPVAPKAPPAPPVEEKKPEEKPAPAPVAEPEKPAAAPVPDTKTEEPKVEDKKDEGKKPEQGSKNNGAPANQNTGSIKPVHATDKK